MVSAPAAIAGVDKGAQPDMRTQQSGAAAGGDVAAELSRHSLRQRRPRLDLVRGSQGHGRWELPSQPEPTLRANSVNAGQLHARSPQSAATDGMDSGQPSGLPVSR